MLNSSRKARIKEKMHISKAESRRLHHNTCSVYLVNYYLLLINLAIFLKYLNIKLFQQCFIYKDPVDTTVPSVILHKYGGSA